MTNRFDDRARGVTLTLLDTESIVADVRKHLGDEVTPEHTVDIGNAPWAVATDPSGKLWAVCVEGVGVPVDEDHPLVLDIYVARPGHMAIMPSRRVRVDLAEVQALATGAEVDLADHVRTFGARLESNFWIMHRQLAARAGAR